MKANTNANKKKVKTCRCACADCKSRTAHAPHMCALERELGDVLGF